MKLFSVNLDYINHLWPTGFGVHGVVNIFILGAARNSDILQRLQCGDVNLCFAFYSRVIYSSELIFREMKELSMRGFFLTSPFLASLAWILCRILDGDADCKDFIFLWPCEPYI